MTENTKKKQSDPQWQKQNLFLKNDAQANSRLRQQITKQSYADNVVQNTINNKILDLKNSAMKLAKSLQNEKRKNLELQAIIKYMEYTMEECKKKQATFRDNINHESVDNLLRKIKKLQYDLDQIYSKCNNLSSKNKVKKNQIDTYRTQRVIDSSIFLKIEKELIQSQMKFKKLSIQKIKCQKQYKKNLKNYIKIKNDIGKQEVQFTIQQQKPQNPQQDPFFINAPKINHAAKFTDLQCTDNKKRRYSSNSKRINSIHQTKKQKNYQEQFAVKKIFLATGLNSSSSFAYHFQNIMNINQHLYRELNDKSDKVAQIKSKLQNLEKIKEKKKINYYKGQPEPTKAQIEYFRVKNLQKSIKQLQFINNCENQKIDSFLQSQRLQDFEKLVEISDNNNFMGDKLNIMLEKFKEIQIKLSPFLSCQEVNQQEVQESISLVKQENIQELISKIKRIQQSEKVMTRNDFKNQYQKMKKNGNKNKPTKIRTTQFKKN